MPDACSTVNLKLKPHEMEARRHTMLPHSVSTYMYVDLLTLNFYCLAS